MKKQFLMWMAVGALSFTACREDSGTSTETNENDSSTPDNAAGTDSSGTTAANYDYENEYRERASRMTSRVSQDLALDAAAQERLRTLFYNRARQLGELETRYSSTNQSAGYAADTDALMTDTEMMDSDLELDSGVALEGEMSMDSGTMATEDLSATTYTNAYPTQYYDELESINSNVDLEVKGFLTPQQYKVYTTNRTKYYDLDMKYKMENGGKIKAEGKESKVKVGDTKIKRDGDEFKYESGDTKIKKEGNETKIKSGDTKIKKEGNKTKYESGDSKIKIEN